MRGRISKVIACLMTVVMVLSIAPLGGLAEMDLFSTRASAYYDGNYEYILENGEATITGYNSNSYEHLTIPTSLSGYKVTKIGRSAFRGCDKLLSVYIPKTIKEVGGSAFYCCTKLEKVVMANSVVNIGEDAFSCCGFLRDVSLSENIDEIADSTFWGCESLKKISIPSKVVRIGHNAFWWTSLEDVIIPKSVIEVGDGAFNCGIKRITFLNKNCNIYKNEYGYTICGDDVVMYGFKNSTASEYAFEYGYKFVPFCSSKHKYGAATLKKATTSSDGSSSKTCSICTFVDHKVIPKVSSFALSSTSYVYDGKVKTPNVIIKDSSGKTLKKDTDYTVSYPSGRKNIGTYKFKIILKGNYTGTKTLTFNILPGVTKCLKATQTTSSIKLTWSKVTGATGYRVYRHNGKKWVKLADTKNTTYTVSKLKAGTNYKYAVKAYTTVGKAVYWSDSFAQLSTTTKPATPTIKVATGKKQATVSWNKITGATGYVVYYSTSKNGTYKKLATVKGASYTAKKLTTGKTYYFKVAAYKMVGKANIYSSYSSVKSVKVK